MNIESSSTHASPVSLPDVPHVSAPPLDISHYVTEDLVPVPTSTGVPTSVDSNAPPALDTATPARIGFLSRLFGSNGLRQQPDCLRRKATSQTAGVLSALVQFPLPPVKTSDFFSFRLAPKQPNKG